MALVRSQAHLDLSQSRWRLLLQSPTLINRICAANNEEEENAEGNCQLIPGLPDEIASECLVRAPLASHHAMTRVCTQWRDVLQTPKFYSDRARRHLADTWICALVRSNGYRNTVRAFDARSKVWISLPPMPANRHRNAVGQEIAAVGGKIVVCGGWRERPLDDVSIFDPVSHRWFAGPPMLSPRAHFVSGVVGDRLYVAGGGDGKQPRSTAAEFFDPEKNQWFPVPSLDAGISFCLGVAMAGKLFVQARGGVPSETLVLLPDLCMWSALRSNMLAWPHRPHAVVEDQILYRADINEGKHELMRYDNQSDEWRSVGIIARGPKRRISDIVGVDGQIWAVAEDFSVGLIQVETTESDRPRVKFVNYAAASESSERLICCRVLVR